MISITEQQRFLYALHVPPASDEHVRAHPEVGKADWAVFAFINERGRPMAIQRFHYLETGEKSWSIIEEKNLRPEHGLNSALAAVATMISFRNDQNPDQVFLDCDGPTAVQKLAEYDWGEFDW